MSRTAALLLAASLFTASCGSGGDGSSGVGIPGVDAPGASATSSAPPGTTMAADSIAEPIADSETTTAPDSTSAPDSTAAPTTTIPTTDAVAVTPAAPTTSTLPPSAQLTDPGQTEWIAGMEEGDPEVESDGANCLPFYEAMATAPHSEAACGPWNSVDGTYIWVVVKGSSNRFIATVWQPAGPFNWVPKLRIREPGEGIWDSFTMKAADIDGGPNQELISGIRYDGSGSILDLDVIDIRSGNPAVVASLPGLDAAIAFTEDSLGIWFWLPDRKPEEALCCPSTFSQFLLSSASGPWSASEGIAGAPLAAIPQATEF